MTRAMAFGTFEVQAGDFKTGSESQVAGRYLYMKVEGRWSREKIPLAAVTKVEVATEESVVRLGGAAGWGLAGAALVGPVGLLAGALLGGRGKKVTFVVAFEDGRKFLATAKPGVYKEILSATM